MVAAVGGGAVTCDRCKSATINFSDYIELCPLHAAASELLEALKDISDFWAYGMSQPDGAIPTAEDERRAEELGRQAAAAVAKAEGRQP